MSVLVHPELKSERDTFVANPKKRAESLATIGRIYGNSISKMNVLKPFSRHQSAQEIREPWVSASKTEAREYGDYYSWLARLSYLEKQRSSIIISKGIVQFVEEYMKKLLKCQTFERGHNVERFATVRLELLNRSDNANNSKMDMIAESRESYASSRYRRDSFASNVYRKNMKTPIALPVSASKTIGMIRKFKNGELIVDDLELIYTFYVLVRSLSQ